MKHSLTAVWVLSMLVACTSPDKRFERMVNIPETGWHQDSVQIFAFSIADTAFPYHVEYLLRASVEYPYSNLYVQYYLYDSAEQLMERRMDELFLADPKTGEPMGSGFGEWRDHRYLFLPNHTFPYIGRYSIHLKQYMRVTTLPYIKAIGIAVAPAP
jgi:gliding motility-associated lipoprotein GldH